MNRSSFQLPVMFFVLAALLLLGAWLEARFLVVPAMDIYLHDTYYVISHNLVLFVLSLYFVACGIVYLIYKKVARKPMSSRLGYLHFWLSLVSIAILFYAMHKIQLVVQRDISSGQSAALPPALLGFLAFLSFLVAQIIFAMNVVWSFFRGVKA